jgi:hypothetical protein
MNILGKVTSFVGGGLFKEIKETVMAYLPPDMPAKEKLEFQLQTQQMLNEKEKEVNQTLNEASIALNERINEQEGTAKDLAQMPILGKVILFFRGSQRPLWGYACLYMDINWFAGTWVFDEQQSLALIIINVLVLGFLFGERTVKNLQPLIEKVFSKG